MIYFVSGHRDLSYEDFKKHYIPIIERTIREDSGTVQNIKRRHSI